MQTKQRRREAVALALFVVLSLTGICLVYAYRDAWSSLLSQREAARDSDVIEGFAQFDLKHATIPVNEIHSGGPPKDGIPAISNPIFVSDDDAGFMQDGDRIIGFNVGGEVRAYPIKILNYHEIVNDVIDGIPVAVTYCPLCDSAAAFDRRTQSGTQEFGVSGLLYNSNVLMFNRGANEQLWSQMKAAKVTGETANEQLVALPIELTTWKEWSTRNPETTVLTVDMGFGRNYDVSPYTRYFATSQLMFPAQPTNEILPAKETVLGIWTNASSKAYPTSSLSSTTSPVSDKIDGKSIVIEYTPEAGTLRVVDADDGVYWMYSFWFAWYAFRPETEIYQHTDSVEANQCTVTLENHSRLPRVAYRTALRRRND